MADRPAGDEEAWRRSLDEERAWREGLYRGEETPLSPEARKSFTGLRWFPPDPTYRVRDVRLDRHAAPRPAPLAATGEDAVTFVEVGVVRFRLLGAECALRVYEPAPGEVEPEERYLFVPFRDATSAHETYGGGRYLDFEPRADDVYELDLNRAYHPYCVFDEAWACTIPPPENRLPLPVRAGERL